MVCFYAFLFTGYMLDRYLPIMQEIHIIMFVSR
jgi:hypothetical protein